MRREQLVRLLHQRRRRTRLLLACLTTAVACGFVAIAVGPRMLIGGTGHAAPAATVSAGQTPPGAAGATGATAGLLALSDHLRLDPREAQANAIRWAGMSEARRRELLTRYWQLASLDSADRDRIFDQYAAFRALPENRQDALRAQARKLRQFMQSLSPQDQAMLESMNDRDRAERLLELWQARHKT
jgi:hypothetical protein